MVRFSRVWRAVWRMGHPQVRWSVWLMTQHGGMPAQLQGDGEGVEALPLNWVECEKVRRDQHVQMRPDKRCPRRGCLALWSWRHAMALQDVPHGLGTDRVPEVG